MFKRYKIRVGDKTTANGIVTSGSPTANMYGIALAREGDTIDCPVCHATGVIQLAGSRIAVKDASGKVFALSDDLCICKCPVHPKLIASQSTNSSG